MTEDRCPRCGQEEEDSFHVFQTYPIVKEIWSQLNFSWVLNNNQFDLWSWLSWIFSVGTNEQCMGFCCGLWGIWTSIKERVITLEVSARPRQRVQRENKSIFFDAAFNSQNHRSASGLIVKNEEGRIIEAKSILHDNVASPFAAEAPAGYQATRFYFIPRSENVEAHRLAKRSLHKGEDQYLVGETSRSICDESEPNRLGYSE
ncbi:hypothetical protein GOBAR_DD29737 [Gossypium barbadense]|nr:hypothetical protein GOBAR_DD29737 [Gossypium barbadense]